MDGRGGGGAKHGGAVRSRVGRRQGRNTGPVVAGVSRKIVNTDWLEVDEGDVPVLYTSGGAEKMDWPICFQSTVIFIESCSN